MRDERGCLLVSALTIADASLTPDCSDCVHVILVPPIGSLKFLENVALGDWKGVVTFQGI